MRRFVDIDLGRGPAPDETTVCRFPAIPFLLVVSYLRFSFHTEENGPARQNIART